MYRIFIFYVYSYCIYEYIVSACPSDFRCWSRPRKRLFLVLARLRFPFFPTLPFIVIIYYLLSIYHRHHHHYYYFLSLLLFINIIIILSLFFSFLAKTHSTRNILYPRTSRVKCPSPAISVKTKKMIFLLSIRSVKCVR